MASATPIGDLRRMKKLALLVALSAVTSACEEPAATSSSGSATAKTSASAVKSAKPATSSSATVSSAAVSAAPSASASASADAGAPGKDIVVGPFKLTVTEKGKGKTIEVAADGTVKPPAEAKSAKPLKFVKNELQDDTGKWILRVTADDSIEVRQVHRVEKDGKVESEKEETKKVGAFKGDDIESEKGTVSLGDDGVITMKGNDGKSEAMKDIKLEGVKPENKRAALLLFIGMFAGGTTTESSTSAQPATSATPSAAPKAEPKPAK